MAGFGNGCHDRIHDLWEDCLRGVFNAKIADKLQAARERLAAATASGVEAVQLDAAQGETDVHLHSRRLEREQLLHPQHLRRSRQD